MMEPWMIAVILKPFVLVLYFLPGAILVWWLKKKLPAGRLRRFLLFSWRV